MGELKLPEEWADPGKRHVSGRHLIKAYSI
jgi:hypothetical protein